MFTTGFKDTVVIKRRTQGVDVDNNRVYTWATILNGIACELYYADKSETQVGQSMVQGVVQKIGLNSTTTIKANDVAIVNESDRYNIKRVLTRRGFGPSHQELILERKSQDA